MKLKSLLPVMALCLATTPFAASAAPAKASGSYPACTKSKTDECRQAQKVTATKHATAAHKKQHVAKRAERKEIARR